MLPCIGYTSPNQSHFTSRHYWEVGETNPQGQVGWLGRYLDQHGSSNNPLQGLGRAREATVTTSSLRERLSASVGTPAAGYPNNTFGRRMASLAALLASPLPLKVVSVQAAGGYDTHADQATTLPANLTTISDSLFAFQRDLEARGIADRVLLHVWSEFGRRGRENGSGTDHGAGGISFPIGSKARGTMVETFPGLTGAGLDGGGNLVATSDFRGVYCSLLEEWLNVDAGPIIPGAASLPRHALVAP